MRRTTTRTSKSQVGLVHGFRSGLEKAVAAQLQAAGVDPRFESIKLPYVEPASNHKYTPDFPVVFHADGVTPKLVIETKGRFLPEDRAKQLLIKEQHPETEVRFVFSRSAAPLYKGAKTTYAMWCEKHGFKYADKRVPQAWLDEMKA